jgi:hypothetical protein
MIYKLEKARNDSWSKRKFFTGTSAKLGPSIDQSGYPVTGLKDTAEEAKFEKAMGLPKGTLAKDGKYWNAFIIIIGEDGCSFDDTIVSDQLKLKFLRAQSLVASGTAELLKSSKAIYLLKSEEAEKEVRNKVRRVKTKALSRVASMTLSERKAVVFMYGHNPNEMTDDGIEDFVFEEVEQNPAKFNIIVDDPNLDDKVFVQALIKANIMEVKQGAYMYNGEAIAYGMDETAAHLAQSKNQDLRIALEKQLKESK